MKISAQEWITKDKQMYFEEFPDSYEILESVKVEFASEEDWIHRRSEIAQLYAGKGTLRYAPAGFFDPAERR